MRRPWLKREEEAGGSTPPPAAITRLLERLRFRVEALNDAAATAARGVESDYAEHGLSLASHDAEAARDLVGALNDRMEKIAADCEQVSTLLARYAELLDDEPDDDSRGFDRAERRPVEPAATAAVAEAGAAAGSQAPATPQPVSEGIRLLATQMSLAGADRGEIERRLRDDFGVADAGAVVDGMFGR